MMSRPTKVKVIEALKAIPGLEFDENGKYNDLCNLLNATVPDTEDRTARLKIKHGEELYLRARKKIGMSDAQIDSYPTAKLLKRACDHISPQTNQDARPKRGEVKQVRKYPPMPDKVELDSLMEARFISQSRNQFDEANLQAELRRLNRVYGPTKPVKTVKTMTFKPIDGITKDNLATKHLPTHYEIFFK